MPSQEAIEKIKKSLESEAADLKKKIAIDDKIPDFGSPEADDNMGIEADKTEQLVNNAAIAQAYRERLEEVENALNKILAGEHYGRCETCGKDIEEDLLLKSPTRRYCQTCSV